MALHRKDGDRAVNHPGCGRPQQRRRANLEDVLHALGSGPARQVYVDGGQVIQTFLREDLIDEITIAWAPVLIGQGLALFGSLRQDIQLTLTSTHRASAG